MSITVLVAARDTPRSVSLLQSLRAQPDIRVLGEARNAPELLSVLRTLKPHILLLSGSVARRSLLDVLALVRLQSPETGVIVLAPRPSWTAMLESVAQGARGYLAATSAHLLVSRAVRAVASGEAWLPRAAVSDVLALVRKAPEGPRSTMHQSPIEQASDRR